MADSSEENQFVVSTHSNIVTKYLGSVAESAVHNVASKFEGRQPVSTIRILETTEERRDVLEDLGYELFDYGMWEYWLFLEESSAELIIGKYLLRWFAPELLGRLRTELLKVYMTSSRNLRTSIVCSYSFISNRPIRTVLGFWLTQGSEAREW